MVLQRLSGQPFWRRGVFLVIPICLPVVAACSGHKSAAEMVSDAAAQAKAACQVFATFKAPTGTDETAQTRYAQTSARAFGRAAGLAQKARSEDPRWTSLASAAKREAVAFDTIAKAATAGFTSTANEGNVLQAVNDAKLARTIFITECAKADPASFKASDATASPSASPSPAPKASRRR